MSVHLRVQVAGVVKIAQLSIGYQENGDVEMLGELFIFIFYENNVICLANLWN